MKRLCPVCEKILCPTERDPAMGICVCGWVGHFSHGLKGPTMRLSYVSIDIETTGLNPDTCQILEIGAVWEDWVSPIEDLPTYRCLIRHNKYRGDAYALAMNANLLRELSGNCTALWKSNVAEDMATWLRNCGWDGRSSITPAGKNFASFDKQFLNKLPLFEDTIKLSYQTIDPAILYWEPDDTKLPDSKTCYSRAGIDSEVKHTALEDALNVVKLVRKGVKP